MKTLVLSTLIAVTAAGNTLASHMVEPRMGRAMENELTDKTKRIDAFKSQLAFHRRNVEVLWNQYNLTTKRIRNSTGNHDELERDKAYFIGVYQKDIDRNVRVAESKRAIGEIEAKYKQAHVDRAAYEAKQLTVLQAQLKAELRKEAKKLEKVKRRSAGLVNDETLPLLQEVEYYVAQAMERAESLSATADRQTIAAH